MLHHYDINVNDELYTKTSHLAETTRKTSYKILVI